MYLGRIDRVVADHTAQDENERLAARDLTMSISHRAT
jgi:hypothetical protein